MVTVRSAELSDVERIAEIQVASWQAAYREILSAQFLAGLSAERRRVFWANNFGDRRVLLAELDGRIEGFISLASAEDSTLGEVQALYLDPSISRRGVGTELMKAGESRLSEVGFTEGILWVLVDNVAARRFYEAMGWTPEARIALMEIGGRAVTEIRYHKDLA
ncbi:GNAT family N-acetyltransferase [soil metagenome]